MCTICISKNFGVKGFEPLSLAIKKQRSPIKLYLYLYIQIMGLEPILLTWKASDLTINLYHNTEFGLRLDRFELSTFPLSEEHSTTEL
jgi:hypothetical protein